MSAIKPPVDFGKFRELLVREVTKVTGLVCIRNEPVVPNAPRPELPYFGYKMTSPAIQKGDSNIEFQSGQEFNYGTQMQMVVSFNCYAKDQDDANSFMHLWQQALNMANIQEDLRKGGLALWDYAKVADLSALLNTGYEGRAQMEVNFGYASNLSANLGTIDIVEIQGTIDPDLITEQNLNINVP